MLMRSFSINNGVLTMGSCAGTLVKPVPAVRVQPCVTPALQLNLPISGQTTQQGFVSPARKGRWSVEEDQRLFNAMTDISGPSTKTWSRASLFVGTRDAKQCWYRWRKCSENALDTSTPKTDHKGKKNQSRVSAGSFVKDAIDLPNDDGSLLCPKELDDFAKETAALSSFAGGFLPNVESSITVDARTANKGRKLASRKRKIDFSDEGLCEWNVTDLLDAIEIPTSRFTIRTVDKIQPIQASYMKLSLPLGSDTLESKMRSINDRINKKPKM